MAACEPELPGRLKLGSLMRALSSQPSRMRGVLPSQIALTVRHDPRPVLGRASGSERPCRARRRTLVWIEECPIGGRSESHCRGPRRDHRPSITSRRRGIPLGILHWRELDARVRRGRRIHVALATLRLRGQPPGGRGYDPTGVLRRALRGLGPRLDRRSARMPRRSASSSASRTPLPCCRSTGSGSAPGA